MAAHITAKQSNIERVLIANKNCGAGFGLCNFLRGTVEKMSIERYKFFAGGGELCLG